MSKHLRNFLPSKIIIVVVAVCLVAGATGVYAMYTGDRIMPHTWVGAVSVGGLTRAQAADTLEGFLERLQTHNIQLSVAGVTEVIDPDSIALDLNIQETVDNAFTRGHHGGWVTQLVERLGALTTAAHLPAPVHVDAGELSAQIDQIAQAVNIPRRDVRLIITGTTVKLATDTAAGTVIDRSAVAASITAALGRLDEASVDVTLAPDIPSANPATGPAAVAAAVKMIARPLTLQYEEAQYNISRDKIASWISSTYAGTTLVAGVDPTKVSAYVTSLASLVDVAPKPPEIQTVDGRVTSFIPAKVGKAVQQDVLVGLITTALNNRASGTVTSDLVTIPVKASAMALAGLDASSGITEIIGTATTPFTGSPHNRILNIKNGVKFLSGTVVQPGEVFSTLTTLGAIDNTTGYLPELVIKGDRTAPEFGGGLCQVSTTLFRAVLNAGLPVVERHNHSYRVSYYEKDGDGNIIGPGLDATIYDPDLDFKFKNDTGHAILIIGYVAGDKATFTIYGTKDGRTSTIDGPHKLTETPPGQTKYIEDPTQPLGYKKQVETPHPGGSAVATYTITYPDGHAAKQVFHSYYRPWPAQYIVNTGATTPSPSASPIP